ncbi:hypothetical protein JTE90_002025 [Oedothorax gibbosus]|uniref:Uncharacterized protein n=1 Tax=Oedothorax gibbosus TaxID=931172 RepID=A0AAV6UPZ9_9ARAC|nr:hypothetical protein JTE90_002025 [Oedothorax gibbosus]
MTTVDDHIKSQGSLKHFSHNTSNAQQISQHLFPVLSPNTTKPFCNPSGIRMTCARNSMGLPTHGNGPCYSECRYPPYEWPNLKVLGSQGDWTDESLIGVERLYFRTKLHSRLVVKK